MNPEQQRLLEAAHRTRHWRRWGPYLAERQWGVVREDYSKDGNAWRYFPFDHAHQRAYRWGEDGIAGLSDNHQRLCLAWAFWNGVDPILKERLFGLANEEGNHGEDVKECYWYLDATPTHSYGKFLYKYPQRRFPYELLRAENSRRSRLEPELDLIDTGLFDDHRYFDIVIEHAKGDVDDLHIRLTVTNRGPEPATLHVLPTLWFRNTWAWDKTAVRPELRHAGAGCVEVRHETLGDLIWQLPAAGELLFTDNDTNTFVLYGLPQSGYAKDAFHEYVIGGDRGAVRQDERGTKAALWLQWPLAAGESRTTLFRLTRPHAAAQDSAQVFTQRIAEADAYYAALQNPTLSADGKLVQRQALAGLLWTKQWYCYVAETWLTGDPTSPPPPPWRGEIRNGSWEHLHAEDILSMPDKWEYPWFAAWDSAFHMIPFALLDTDFAKRQLALFLREWYMHPNGQLPAYEWNFNDVNPPVHAWSCWRVFQIDRKQSGGERGDIHFLERVFHKLLLNFTWWVNRKDSLGNNVFEGGFLGLDNIGVFDRSKPLPGGGVLEQSDATAWMAMFSLNMLRMACELALHNAAYEDIASKFFEHFLRISHAMPTLWSEEDGFYYDLLRMPNMAPQFVKVRSMVGLLPLFAVDTLDDSVFRRLPSFAARSRWFIENRPDLTSNLEVMAQEGKGEHRLLALVNRERLRRILSVMLDENEFLSPYGIRSLSKYHEQHPYQLDGSTVRYEPAESTTSMFGGNSNWRGPVWFPVNYLLIESLQKLHYYYGDTFIVEFPTRSGNWVTLDVVAAEISRRLSHLFLRGADGRRPCFGDDERMQFDEHFRDHVLFHEYFHGDTGAGLGASHQTGWTALVAKLLQQSGE